MKTLSVLEARKTIDSLLDDSFVTSKKSSTIDVRDQIKIKYKTANRWNYK